MALVPHWVSRRGPQNALSKFAHPGFLRTQRRYFSVIFTDVMTEKQRVD